MQWVMQFGHRASPSTRFEARVKKNSERVIRRDGGEFLGDFRVPWSSTRSENFGNLRCTNCKQRRAVDLYWCGQVEVLPSLPGATSLGLHSPGLGIFKCRECGTEHPAGLWWDQRVLILLFGDAVSVA